MPAVFAAGASPQAAAGAGITVVSAGRGLRGTAKAAVAGGEAGRAGLDARADSGLPIGAAAAGPDAPDWMSEITVAIRAGVPLATLAGTVPGFPACGRALEPVLREPAGKVA